jgi:hypothetical protein
MPQLHNCFSSGFASRERFHAAAQHPARTAHFPDQNPSLIIILILCLRGIFQKDASHRMAKKERLIRPATQADNRRRLQK